MGDKFHKSVDYTVYGELDDIDNRNRRPGRPPKSKTLNPQYTSIAISILPEIKKSLFDTAMEYNVSVAYLIRNIIDYTHLISQGIWRVVHKEAYKRNIKPEILLESLILDGLARLTVKDELPVIPKGKDNYVLGEELFDLLRERYEAEVK